MSIRTPRSPGSRIVDFARDRAGSLAIMAGIAMPLVLFAMGAATDIARAVEAKAEARRTLDAVLLRLANAGIADGDLNAEGAAAVRQHLLLNEPWIKLDDSSFTPGADADGDGFADTINGRISISIDNYIMGTFGSDSMGATVASGIEKPKLVSHEIALVLDVSGSMADDLNGQTRLKRMQEAVDAMFVALDSKKISTIGDLSIAVVPYSTSVNIADVPGWVLEGSSISGGTAPAVGSDVWAAERVDATNASGFDLSDASPATAGIPFVTATEIHDATPSSRLLPLTNEKSKYKAALSGLTANGWTAAHVGMIWGVYALAPSWATVWAQDPQPYGAAEKTIVVLTDGAFNTTHAIGAGSTTDGDVSNSYFQASCDLAKAKGIRIYTVALSLDSVSEARLDACATGSGGKMFTADNAAELTTAFEEIAQRIGKLRITS